MEDEWLIADLLEHVLVDAGFGISGQVGRVDDSLALIEVAEFDAALLDVGLNGAFSLPIVRRLIECNILFLFLTGHVTADVRRVSAADILEKAGWREFISFACQRLVRDAIAANPELLARLRRDQALDSVSSCDNKNSKPTLRLPV